MLIKRIFGAMRLAHASLAFTGLMWILPFLYYHHDYPLVMFYQEWGAFVLGLCAMPLLMTRRCWQQPEIPRIILLPAGLSLLVWLQFAAGRVAYLDQALLLTLYLLWAALVIMLGHRLREELGLPVLATALAAFLLLGAELSALIGVLQHYAWHTFLDAVVTTKTSAAVFGNMAQPNHFADYITLGLISLGLLRLHWRLRAWQVALLAVPLLFVLTLSGSRSAWLYLLCMAGMSFMWHRRERKGGVEDSGNPPAYPLRVLRVLLGLQPLSVNSTRSLLRSGLPAFGTTTAYPLRVDKSSLPLLHYSLLLLLGFGLMHFVVQILWPSGSTGSVTAGQRLFIEAASGSIRLHIWREAWLIFSQFPLLGAGFGQFAWQHFLLGPVLRNTGITGLYNNAHNLVLQIAAEMGMAGLLILLGALGLWLWQARSAQRTIYHWWGYGLLAVLGIHSLLEYPLWYAYFLGVAALTLGIFESTTYRLELREKHILPNPLPEVEGTIASSPLGRGLKRGLMGRLSVAAMLLLGLLSLSQMLYLYKYRNFDFETLANALLTSATDGSYAQRVRIQLIHDNMVAAQGHALLLRPYVEIFLAEAEWDHITDQGALNERVMHYLPISSVAYRQGWLLARAGRQAEACAQIERAIWADPSSFPETLEALRELVGADTDPARFSAFMECVLQKYDGRQREVHAKF